MTAVLPEPIGSTPTLKEESFIRNAVLVTATST